MGPIGAGRPLPCLAACRARPNCPPRRASAKAALPAPERSVDQVTVRRGDTLIDILESRRHRAAEAHAAVRSLRTRIRPAPPARRPGAADPGGRRDAARAPPLARARLRSRFRPLGARDARADGSYAAAKVARPQRRELVHRAGVIDDSLYCRPSARRAPRVTVDLIRLFSWDVDFQRDMRRGDQFETLFEDVSVEDGSGARGRRSAVRCAVDRRTLLEGYRFELGTARSPTSTARARACASSCCAPRWTGPSCHRASACAAIRSSAIPGCTRRRLRRPNGTPINAAGDGNIEVAKRNGGYGKYVRIRHNSEYRPPTPIWPDSPRASRRRRVHQGQVIGYVGSTGRSTGPHLHYEVLRNDAQINPLRIKQPPNQQLAGAELERFRAEVDRIDRLRADPPRSTQVASRGQ